MEILAMYDIADPKRLRNVEKTMRRFGVRVQKSVFECSLKEGSIQQMKHSVENIMNLDDDSFKIYPLLNQAREKQTIIGKGEIPEFPDFAVV
jgi:CRISPR-associated protein Cas2